jgi:hypothetical protein
LRIAGELLERSIGEAIGVEDVDGNVRVGVGRYGGCRWGADSGEDNGLARGVEGESVCGEGKLEVVKGTIERLVGEVV